jgi:hypothetical protein
MEPMLAYQSGRLDRYVRRGYVRLREETSRSRTSYWIEEALRLAQLPEEDEGRIYCFRRVDFSGTSSDANRRTWIVAVQNTLTELAARAVHASDANADSSNVVYFHNREEALEILLRRGLRAHVSDLPWYSASLLGTASNHADQHIPIILDQLFSRGATAYPAVAAGAAEVLFSALDGCDPVALLSPLSAERLREWVHELDRPPAVAADLLPIPLPKKLLIAVRRAASNFGWHDPGTVWLTAQAVVSVAPSTLRSGTAVRHARTTLRALAAERTDELHALPDLPKFSRVLHFSDEIIQLETATGMAAPLLSTKGQIGSDAASSSVIEYAPEIADTLPAVARHQEHNSDPIPHLATVRGDETGSAGLYFLLNAIRRVGIVPAQKACPALTANDLVSHILRQLALRADVAEDDPIQRCLPSTDKEFTLSAEEIADLRRSTAYLPPGFEQHRLTSLDAASILRTWALAVRRWCWRTGRLTIKQIVHRRGWVWLTRTDLDITLPFEEADIRIRRIGLDIDPGWVPWFGLRGRVVRFHYRDRELEARQW